MADDGSNRNPNNGGRREEETPPFPEEKKRRKVVVVMGATGAGKSRLAIDLASHFPAVEVVNGDSMQVYRGLDVLTNKVPLSERNGVPHHLLGAIDASVEFTSRSFRDRAIPIVDDILSRNGLPVIVGGTNYYIQALVSTYLLDDIVEDLDACSLSASHDIGNIDPPAGYERLKEIDPLAANRIHPNDHRKIQRYLTVYASTGMLPSTLFRGVTAEVNDFTVRHGQKWGRIDSFRYNCCFIWVDASLPMLDRYVDQRVDAMIKAGLLNEVYDIYNPNADYTKGLSQAIGVREFEGFFTSYFAYREGNEASTPNFSDYLVPGNSKLHLLLAEAIDKMKSNTRRLVRRQKRRINQLKSQFGWDLHWIDATEAFSGNSEHIWERKVIEPCVEIVSKFLVEEDICLQSQSEFCDGKKQNVPSRDLWTQFVCEACGNQVLRGTLEWEQHKQGRGHRKRMLRLKKKHQAS